MRLIFPASPSNGLGVKHPTLNQQISATRKQQYQKKINSLTMLASSRTRHREGEDPQKNIQRRNPKRNTKIERERNEGKS
jgi:hypothetical protein